jgi:diguanylate cyclase (GGDEF)-like protein
VKVIISTSRRLVDRASSATRLRSVVEVSTTPDAARLGRWLMLFNAAVVAVSGWYVDNDTTDRYGHWAPLVVAALLLLAGPTALLPWSRLPRRAVLFYPLTGIALLGVVGYLAPAAGPAYLSVLTLWFLFIGVTQKAGTAWFVAPVAAVAWTVISWPIDAQRGVRLVLAMIVWVLLGDVLAVRAQQVDKRTQDLSLQAGTDALTGLANRRTLQRELDATAPGDVVVVLDIDHFKLVNDTLGHDAGDRVLVDLARVLTSVVRSGDVVARLGGEEFVLLLRRPVRTPAGGRTVFVPVPHSAGPVVERLRVTWGQLYPHITWSAGVCAHEAGVHPAQTLSLADEALYAAKRGGRDRVVVYSAALPTSEPARVA